MYLMDTFLVYVTVLEFHRQIKVTTEHVVAFCKMLNVSTHSSM